MKEVQRDKKSYNVPAVIKRMLEHMAKQDKAQFGRIFLYTLLAGIYPFFCSAFAKDCHWNLGTGWRDGR